MTGNAIWWTSIKLAPDWVKIHLLWDHAIEFARWQHPAVWRRARFDVPVGTYCFTSVIVIVINCTKTEKSRSISKFSVVSLVHFESTRCTEIIDLLVYPDDLLVVVQLSRVQISTVRRSIAMRRSTSTVCHWSALRDKSLSLDTLKRKLKTRLTAWTAPAACSVMPSLWWFFFAILAPYVTHYVYLLIPDVIHDCRPARALPSPDKSFLSLSELRASLALSVKVSSVSAPSVWEWLSYNWRSVVFQHS